MARVGLESTASRKELLILFAFLSAAVLASAYKPYDGLTWMLEVGPVLLGVPLLFTPRRFFR